ncbi:hypothetical protein JW935_25075 [candidate division KSB1 bacterium]|nr:hypothetical protein [candidate division KSB1 bacterium]
MKTILLTVLFSAATTYTAGAAIQSDSTQTDSVRFLNEIQSIHRDASALTVGPVDSITTDSIRSIDNNRDVRRSKSPSGAMLRSIVVPGWGQLYNGKWFKAILVAGTEIGLIANAVLQNQLAVQSINKFDREFYADNRSLSLWWLGAVILYSMGDAYVDAHLYRFDESPRLSLLYKKLPTGKAFQTEYLYVVCLNIPLK